MNEYPVSLKPTIVIVLFILLIFPVVCSLVNRETLLELRSELRSDAFLVTIIDFFWDLNPRLTARKSCILTIRPWLFHGCYDLGRSYFMPRFGQWHIRK